MSAWGGLENGRTDKETRREDRLVRVFMGRDGNGKRRYLNKTVRGNKKDAEGYLNTTLTQMSTGAFVEPVKPAVNEYLDKWLATAAKLA
jgi:integrase